jgi:hypothetical protein
MLCGRMTLAGYRSSRKYPPQMDTRYLQCSTAVKNLYFINTKAFYFAVVPLAFKYLFTWSFVHEMQIFLEVRISNTLDGMMAAVGSNILFMFGGRDASAIKFIVLLLHPLRKHGIGSQETPQTIQTHLAFPSLRN